MIEYLNYFLRFFSNFQHHGKTMLVEQIFFDNTLRNFSYLIRFNSGKIFCIDPFEGEKVAEKLKSNEKVDTIINTHDHCDHHEGNEYLRKNYNCKILAHKESIIEHVSILADDQQVIHQEGEWSLRVVYTPGHTLNHICVLLKKNDIDYAIFTGDCYFYAGVGNCYNGGDVGLLYQSIQKYFVGINEEIIIYPGHEYLKRNIEFTLSIEESNQDARSILKLINDNQLKTIDHIRKLKDEQKVNLFLRLANGEIRNKLKLTTSTDKEVFTRLREMRNNW